ncbi:MAG: hypothetical protein KGL74_06090, partial [Elusimicrobia bacterium]|nr:hypothetical protein [Elusimicrobiota bacterium]
MDRLHALRQFFLADCYFHLNRPLPHRVGDAVDNGGAPPDFGGRACGKVRGVIHAVHSRRFLSTIRELHSQLVHRSSFGRLDLGLQAVDQFQEK